MYPCSNAFHEAVAANEPQKAMFLFRNGVLTNEDFDIDAGIVLKDYFCTKENLGIGEAISNELSFRLMNEKQLLNTFTFGEMNALLGVRISTGNNPDGLSLVYRTHTWTFSGGKLKKDGTNVASQPSFTVASMAAYDGVINCFSADGSLHCVNAETGRSTIGLLSFFMQDKATRWAGMTYSYDDRILTINNAGMTTGGRETYEFVPLGKFIAERPEVVDDAQLDITCNDLMQKFDKDMDVSVEYPITLKNLLTAVCQSEGIPLATSSFINKNYSVSEAPREFSACTKRDVIRWIAEAAGSNAKITRDGALALVWVNSTGQSFDESSYTGCRPYYYQTDPVDRVKCRDLNSGEDTDEGSGENVYLIQDNPFLR